MALKSEMHSTHTCSLVTQTNDHVVITKINAVNKNHRIISKIDRRSQNAGVAKQYIMIGTARIVSQVRLMEKEHKTQSCPKHSTWNVP